ncbi:hypothetical protein LCGC14_2690410, partial [marine sediment metagenome]
MVNNNNYGPDSIEFKLNISMYHIYLLFLWFLLCILGLFIMSIITNLLVILIILIVLFIIVTLIHPISMHLERRSYLRGINKDKEEPDKIFKINKIVELRLIQNRTYIYINNKKFIQCMYLLMNIPKNNVDDYDEIKSIDDAAEVLDNSLE